MEGGPARRDRDKLAAADGFGLLHDPASLLELYTPLPAPVSTPPVAAGDLYAPPLDASPTSSPLYTSTQYAAATQRSAFAPVPRTPELSLQETEELLRTLDATSFFQDQPLGSAAPPVSVGLSPVHPSSSQAMVAAPAPRQARSPAPKRRTVRAKPKSSSSTSGATTKAAASPPASSTALTTKTRSGKSVPTTATGKMRNPSRERLQAELAYLRNKVVELEDELTTLHEKSSGAAPQVETDAHGRALVPVWQRIADRQLEGRRRAEAENLRLKGTLEGQIMLARHLENLLRKRPNVGVQDGSSSDALVLGGSPHKKRLRLGGDDPEYRSRAYEHLLAEVDDAYARMDLVFAQNGLEASVDDSIRHATVQTRRGPDGRDVLYAELLDINIIPFELERVGAAAWRSVKRQYYAKTPYDSYQRAPDDENTIALKYRMTCERKGQQVPLDAVLVMRRFVERERVAIVWRCVSRAARGQSPLAGMFTDETGWSVFKSVSPSAELSLAGAGTVMHSCVHVVPKRASGVVVSNEDGGLRGGSMRVSEMQHEIGLLTNAVIDAYEDVVVSMNSTMEDILLEETLATPDPVALRVWAW